MESGLAQLLLEHSPDPLLLIDPDGSISFLNAAAEELFGYSRAQLLGADSSLLLAEASREPFHGVLAGLGASAPRSGQPFAGSGRRADGTELPVEITCSLLPSDAGAGPARVVRRALGPRRRAPCRLRRPGTARLRPPGIRPGAGGSRRRRLGGRRNAPPSYACCVHCRSRRVRGARRRAAGRGAARSADLAAQRHRCSTSGSPRRCAARIRWMCCC